MVEEALRAGVKQRKKAMLALVDAYGEYAFSYNTARPMSEETRASWHKRIEDLYKEMLRDYPTDVDLLMSYANTLQPKRKLPIVLQALKMRPDDTKIMTSVAFARIGSGDIKTGVDEYVRVVRLKSADPDSIESDSSDLCLYLRAQDASQYIPEVQAAALEALAAQSKAGVVRAVFASAILHVEFGQAKVGVEEFIRGVHMESADENTIQEKLEKIAAKLSDGARENAQYIDQVSLAADEALKARAEAKARAGKKAPQEKKK
jgi:hypothetical protein